MHCTLLTQRSHKKVTSCIINCHNFASSLSMSGRRPFHLLTRLTTHEDVCTPGYSLLLLQDRLLFLSQTWMQDRRWIRQANKCLQTLLYEQPYHVESFWLPSKKVQFNQELSYFQCSNQQKACFYIYNAEVFCLVQLYFTQAMMIKSCYLKNCLWKSLASSGILITNEYLGRSPLKTFIQESSSHSTLDLIQGKAQVSRLLLPQDMTSFYQISSVLSKKSPTHFNHQV